VTTRRVPLLAPWLCAAIWFGSYLVAPAGLTALPKDQTWNQNIRKLLVDELLRAPDLKETTGELKSWLIKNYSPAQLASKPAWGEILGLYKWQSLRSANRDVAEPTWAWLMNDPALTDDFFRNLSPQDNVDRVLGILEDLHRAAPDKFPAYNALALAFALVWDDPPSWRIHNQMGNASVPQDSSTVTERFLFYTAGNDRNSLEWDARKLPAEHLKFVVDTAISLDELRWAQKHVRMTKTTYDTVFFLIKYDDQRFNTGQFDWPFPVYFLAAIQKKGGICVDQAYFAAISGKANGIPTLFFSGPGRRGDHAWFGYLKGKNKWALDCGRYAYDKYATGYAQDPQTGQVITDHELDYLSKGFRLSAAYHSAQCMADAARLMAEAGDRAGALAAINDAIQQEGREYGFWLFKETLLTADQDADLDLFYKNMIQQFSSYPDLKVETQEKLMAINAAQGNTNAVKKIGNAIIQRNSNDRADLSLAMIEKNFGNKLAADDYSGALKELISATRRFSAENGPMLAMLEHFVSACLVKNEENTADKAVRYFKNHVKYDPATGRQFDDLEQAIKRHRAERAGTDLP